MSKELRDRIVDLEKEVERLRFCMKHGYVRAPLVTGDQIMKHNERIATVLKRTP